MKVWRETGGKLFFEVKDSGIGIPQDEQDKIFAMYYQVKDQNGGKPATGTGIGLAVSKRLAQNMGGDIVVRSTPGKAHALPFLLMLRSLKKRYRRSLKMKNCHCQRCMYCWWKILN